jgi:hypothetical protein
MYCRTPKVDHSPAVSLVFVVGSRRDIQFGEISLELKNIVKVEENSWEQGSPSALGRTQLLLHPLGLQSPA